MSTAGIAVVASRLLLLLPLLLQPAAALGSEQFVFTTPNAVLDVTTGSMPVGSHDTERFVNVFVDAAASIDGRIELRLLGCTAPLQGDSSTLVPFRIQREQNVTLEAGNPRMRVWFRIAHQAIGPVQLSNGVCSLTLSWTAAAEGSARTTQSLTLAMSDTWATYYDGFPLSEGACNQAGWRSIASHCAPTCTSDQVEYPAGVAWCVPVNCLLDANGRYLYNPRDGMCHEVASCVDLNPADNSCISHSIPDIEYPDLEPEEIPQPISCSGNGYPTPDNKTCICYPGYTTIPEPRVVQVTFCNSLERSDPARVFRFSAEGTASLLVLALAIVACIRLRHCSNKRDQSRSSGFCC